METPTPNLPASLPLEEFQEKVATCMEMLKEGPIVYIPVSGKVNEFSYIDVHRFRIKKKSDRNILLQENIRIAKEHSGFELLIRFKTTQREDEIPEGEVLGRLYGCIVANYPFYKVIDFYKVGGFVDNVIDYEGPQSSDMHSYTFLLGLFPEILSRHKN